LNEKAAVTPEVSIRISEALGQDSADIWFNIQNDYDCRPPTQSLYAGKLCSCNPPLADIPSRPPI
jgi:plasmid maintenance system antidote protein VapI